MTKKIQDHINTLLDLRGEFLNRARNIEISDGRSTAPLESLADAVRVGHCIDLIVHGRPDDALPFLSGLERQFNNRAADQSAKAARLENQSKVTKIIVGTLDNEIENERSRSAYNARWATALRKIREDIAAASSAQPRKTSHDGAAPAP